MKFWAQPVVIIFAIAALLCGVIFMPASELLPAQTVPGPILPGLSPIRSFDMMQGFRNIGDGVCQVLTGQDLDKLLSKPVNDQIPGEVRSYTIYSIFLAAALILAAIAINAAGRWDSEEKTTIPYKK